MTLLKIPFTYENTSSDWTKEIEENSKRPGRHLSEPKKCNNMTYLDDGEELSDYSGFTIPVFGEYLDTERIRCKIEEDVQKFLVQCAVKGATLAVKQHNWNTRYWFWADVCSMVAICSEDVNWTDMGTYQTKNKLDNTLDDPFVINTDMRSFKYSYELSDKNFNGMLASMTQTFVDLAFAMSNFKHSKHGSMTAEIANSVKQVDFHLNRSSMANFPQTNMFEK